jgi:hypothetical protein
MINIFKKQYEMNTVAVTSVGMFGGGHSGWGLTPTGSSLGLVVGELPGSQPS